jgi:23S rRNA (cytosine1962-C5)-methyltransferase
MANIILRRNEEKRLLQGHLWIFSNEIQKIEGAAAAGDIVTLISANGQPLGQGFYNPHSLIAFRLLTRDPAEPVDQGFWVRHIEKAYRFRQALFPGSPSGRIVFGESDLLPGLIVDKYGDYLAVQFLSAGVEKISDTVVAALNQVLAPAGIIARNDSSLRRLEGLEEKVEVLSGQVPETVIIEEDGCRFAANLHGGQKTGFFFDQRENRAALARYCTGRRLLDAFCHTGAFGVYALKGGAREVVWLDSSSPALALAEENARLNGYAASFHGECADVFEYLEAAKVRNEKYDIINLDPPALIKSKKHFPAGYKAYRKLNTAALTMLPSGGILATSSCSHHLGPADFRAMLREAAGRAGKEVRVLEIRSQARDHPVLLSMPETEYLKFAILEVV